MANTFSYADIFQTVLDEQIVQESVTGWMDAQGVIYNGGKSVKIPKVSMSGLGDYSRASGYAKGAITLTYENKTMTQDRGAQFILDQMDVNETNFVAEATRMLAEFQRVHVIPEIDAYRLSALATAAPAANVESSYTPSSSTILAKLAAATKIGDEDCVIYMSPDALEALEVAVGANNISSVNFIQGGFDQRVPAFNGRPIIKTDQSRLVTAITTKNISGNDDGGWAKAATASDINFMVVPRYAPIAVDKLDEPKIFEPAQVQDYSGWLIDYRRYHDLWVADNKKAGIYVNTK